MLNKLSFDEVCELADSIYFEVIRKLNIESECVEDYPDGSGSTDTEKGQELYWLIEDTIKNCIDFNEGEF